MKRLELNQCDACKRLMGEAELVIEKHGGHVLTLCRDWRSCNAESRRVAS